MDASARHCKVCRQPLSITRFNKKSGVGETPRYSSTCKDCENKKRRQRRQKQQIQHNNAPKVVKNVFGVKKQSDPVVQFFLLLVQARDEFNNKQKNRNISAINSDCCKTNKRSKPCHG